ncbi:unnamed protein product [Lampetra fluviatilis]
MDREHLPPVTRMGREVSGPGDGSGRIASRGLRGRGSSSCSSSSCSCNSCCSSSSCSCNNSSCSSSSCNSCCSSSSGSYNSSSCSSSSCCRVAIRSRRRSGSVEARTDQRDVDEWAGCANNPTSHR